MFLSVRTVRRLANGVMKLVHVSAVSNMGWPISAMTVLAKRGRKE
jgi:hypothetical protein